VVDKSGASCEGAPLAVLLCDADSADSADVGLSKMVGLEFSVVCSFSFYIWSCDEWASVRRPESTLPLFNVLRSDLSPIRQMLL
jgi:hypothetical protein